VALVVLNWNGLNDTRGAIRSLLRQSHGNREIFVVDNASANDEAGTLAAEFGSAIRLLRNDSNRGFTGGNNVAMALALAEGRAQHIALLNNDAEADELWLEHLVAAAASLPRAGALASHMVFFDAPTATENAGVEILSTGEALPRGRHRPIAEFPTRRRLLGACGGAVLYRAEALRRVGIFRDDYFANFEDVDLSLRLEIAGYECWFVPETFVRHKLNASIKKVRDDNFRIRSVRNMTHAYWVNVPWPVALLNLPWHLMSWVVVPLLSLVLGQWDLARILTTGRWRTLRALPSLLADRRALRPLRRGSWWQFWRLQHSSLAPYLRFLRDVVIQRRRRYME
jgi:GT2 family glycosyltransferase